MSSLRKGSPALRAPDDPVTLARTCLGSSPRARDLHFAPDIPPALEKKVRAVHAVHLPPHEPIAVLYDATVFGSAEEGFLLTPDRICWKNRFQHPRQLLLRDLDPTTLLPLRDGVGVAGGVIATQGISTGGLAELLTTLAESAAPRAAEASPYRAIDSSSQRAVTHAITLAREHLGEVPRVYYHPAIPPPKLANARAVHDGRLDAGEPIAVVYDGTLFASAREGFLLTPARICWKNLAEEPASVEWRAVDPDLVMSSPYAVRIMGWEIRVLGGPSFAERVADTIVAMAKDAARRPLDDSW